MSAPAGAPLRVVVVGTGFGCRIQVPCLRGAGFEVVGLVGTDARRTAERAAANGVPASFTDLGEAIARTGADAVAVSTPPDRHAAVAIAAIEQGCHVMSEKPFAVNLAEARAMLDAAECAGVVHMIGHEFRFVPQRALIARAIAEGIVGEPRFVAVIGFADYVWRYASELPSWWLDPEAGGGWLGCMGSHVIDQVRAEVGEFASVSASLSRTSSKVDRVEDSFSLRFQLANGAEGVMHQTGGAIGPDQHFFRVAGSKGTIWLDGATVRFADGEGARELPIPADLELPPPPPASTDPRQQGVEWQYLTEFEIAPYTALGNQFRRAIQGDKAFDHHPRPATFADGVACMSVMDAIRASAADGGAVVQVA